MQRKAFSLPRMFRREVSKTGDFRYVRSCHNFLALCFVGSKYLGMDYPDVSVVLQVRYANETEHYHRRNTVAYRGLSFFLCFLKYGAPSTQEGYIHRIGRTGRAGSNGEAVLLLLPFEQKILKGLKYRGLAVNQRLQRVIEDLQSASSSLEPARNLVSNGHRVLLPASETAYLSLLACYSTRADFLALSNEQVLDIANSFANEAGLEKKPEMSPTLAKTLKLDI